jgi:hypothetical protein
MKCGRIAEEFRAVDIADDVVDILFVDNDFRVSALYEFLAELIERGIGLYSLNFGSRHHAVAHLCVGEVECILEDLHLVIDIRVFLCIIDTRLHQVVEVNLREAFVLSLLVHLHSHQ